MFTFYKNPIFLKSQCIKNCKCCSIWNKKKAWFLLCMILKTSYNLSSRYADYVYAILVIVKLRLVWKSTKFIVEIFFLSAKIWRFIAIKTKSKFFRHISLIHLLRLSWPLWGWGLKLKIVLIVFVNDFTAAVSSI